MVEKCLWSRNQTAIQAAAMIYVPISHEPLTNHNWYCFPVHQLITVLPYSFTIIFLLVLYFGCGNKQVKFMIWLIVYFFFYYTFIFHRSISGKKLLNLILVYGFKYISCPLDFLIHKFNLICDFPKLKNNILYCFCHRSSDIWNLALVVKVFGMITELL